MTLFQKDEYLERIHKIKRRMSDAGIDVLVASDPANMNYLTGYDGWSFYVHQGVIIGPSGDPVFWGRGMDANGVEAVVADTDKDAFSVSAAFASWRGHEVPGSALRRVRRNGFVAYGSCDFNEPTEALQDLGFLGGGA